MMKEIIIVLLMVCFCLAGCGEKTEHNMIWEYKEQTFQLRLDKACTEHKHEQPTIHHPDLDGQMRDYVFNGVEWKEIIYDKELTLWAEWGDEGEKLTGEDLQKEKELYKQRRSKHFIFSDKWERDWSK